MHITTLLISAAATTTKGDSQFSLFFSIQLDRVYDSESRDLCSKVNDRFEVKENNVSRRWTDVGLQNFNGSFFFVESSKNNGKRIPKTKTIKYGTISGTHTSAKRDGRQEEFPFNYNL